MLISLIAALSKNGVIGQNSKLPWHIPAELKYFRTITEGKPIIMGRKTFESINSKPLPKRQNIILTHEKNFHVAGVAVVHSVAEALQVAMPADEIMVIGGASVFEAFLPHASKLYLSIIHQNYEGDTFFPKVEWKYWHLVAEENKGEFTAQIFEKINLNN